MLEAWGIWKTSMRKSFLSQVLQPNRTWQVMRGESSKPGRRKQSREFKMYIETSWKGVQNNLLNKRSYTLKWVVLTYIYVFIDVWPNLWIIILVFLHKMTKWREMISLCLKVSIICYTSFRTQGLAETIAEILFCYPVGWATNPRTPRLLSEHYVHSSGFAVSSKWLTISA